MNEQIDQLMEQMSALDEKALKEAKDYLATCAQAVTARTDLSTKMAQDIAQELERHKEGIVGFARKLDEIQQVWVNGENYYKVSTLIDYIKSHDDAKFARLGDIERKHGPGRFDKCYAGEIAAVENPNNRVGYGRFPVFTDEGYMHFDVREQKFVVQDYFMRKPEECTSRLWQHEIPS